MKGAEPEWRQRPTCQVQGSVGVQVSRADGTSCGAPLQQQAVVGPAEQLFFPQGELVPRQQLSAAHRAPKTLDVVNVIPGSHHQIAAAESQVAFGAFYSKESADVRQAERRSKRIIIITRCGIMCCFPPFPRSSKSI